MRAGGLILLCLLVSGCASSRQRRVDAEARGFERGYTKAVKEQYWILQNQQRRPAETTQPSKP